jgi:hypothetical protein
MLIKFDSKVEHEADSERKGGFKIPFSITWNMRLPYVFSKGAGL